MAWGHGRPGTIEHVSEDMEMLPPRERARVRGRDRKIRGPKVVVDNAGLKKLTLELAGHRDRAAGFDPRQVPHADLVPDRRVSLGELILDRSVRGLLHEHDHRRRREHTSAADVACHEGVVYDSFEVSFHAGCDEL